MMTKRIAYFTTMMAFIAGCSSFSSQAQDQSSLVKLEPLHSISFDDDRVVFRVKSTGCTGEEDFKLHWIANNSQAQLAIERVREDRCRRMPKVVKLEKTLDYSLTEPNLPVMLLNPFMISGK